MNNQNSSASVAAQAEPKKIKNATTLIEVFLFGNHTKLFEEKPAHQGLSSDNGCTVDSLVGFLCLLLDLLASTPNQILGDQTVEFAKLLNKFQSFIWILRAACAYEFTRGSRQMGGRGNKDCDGTGCVQVYKDLATIFDKNWKTIAEEKVIFEELCIAHLPKSDDEKTFRAARNVLIKRLFKLKKGFFNAAISSSSPEYSIKLAVKKVNNNEKYTIENFKADLYKENLWTQKKSEKKNFASKLFNNRIEASYKSYELLQAISKTKGLSIENTLDLVVEFYYASELGREKAHD